NRLPIRLNPAAAAQIAHHVPVQSRLVLAATFWIRRPERQVKRAANLLIEKRIARVSGDRVVATEGGLAQDAGTGILIEHANEELFALRCRSIHDAASP